jgi:NitT/TauT family transport system substrate-binding protein
VIHRDVVEPLTSRFSRRRWLVVATGALGALSAACSAPAAPAKPAESKPAAAPKPTEAPKPAAPVASPAPAASPAAAAPAPSPAASPAAKPAGQAAPATAKPSSVANASQVMNWFAQSSQGGFFAGLKNGHYEKQNIKMTNAQGGPQVAAIPLVAAGQHTFGMSSADQVLLAREEGIPITMVFGTFQINPQGLMFHASKPVKSFEELNGRPVYVSGAGVFWRVIQAKYKLDKVQQFAYNGQLATFLSNEENVSQCFVSSEPVILKKQGKDVGYLLNADSGFNPYQNAMVCLEKTVKEQPDLVQAYVTASLQGWWDYMDNPQTTLDFIKSDFNKDYDLEIAKDIFAVEKNQLLTGKTGYDKKVVGTMTQARWKDLHDLMKSTGVLKKDIDLATAFDTRFIDAAHKALAG